MWKNIFDNYDNKSKDSENKEDEELQKEHFRINIVLFLESCDDEL